MNEEKDFELLTIKEACAFMRVSRSTLDKLRIEGTIPFIKYDKKVLFKKDVLVDYIHDNQFQYESKETN